MFFKKVIISAKNTLKFEKMALKSIFLKRQQLNFKKSFQTNC
ncbi:hypothetical protein KAOT1_17698 [Kordia algicida OT-1]|uniref:Uncharacterized protein n=1 Tax=Kordia algicida OT-1 TaxID=391587 RepID=A9DT41_9FLAO|nr:hypothetical protein KAOT1_17698 [Kordia algicida OT-1]